MHQGINYLTTFKSFKMKKSDVLIVAIGIIVIGVIFAAITYLAFILNNGNAGFNGGF